MFDLDEPGGQLTRLVRGVRDDQLPDPTPCEGWAVRDLLAHVHQFATVFAANARKEPFSADGDLPDRWRTAVPAQVDDFVGAWRSESAWQGRVSAGGLEMSAGDNALVGMEEVVLHSWDLARATGQSFEVEDSWLDVVDRYFEVFAEPIAAGEGPYADAVDVPPDASRFDRILGAAGRDPGWQPATR